MLADADEYAAIVRFAVARDGGPLQAGDDLLVATTDAWKLVGNAAVAVDPELMYVRAKTGTLDAPVVLAEALVERVLGERGVRILERFRGAAIDGVRYDPPLRYLPAGLFGERGHTVLLAGFVTATEGSGLVAVAPAFGEDDLRLATRYDLAVVNPLDRDGAFDARVGRYAGRLARDAGPALVHDLRARGRVLSSESRTAAAPACPSCLTPLLAYAKAAWFVSVPGRRGDADVLVSSDRRWGAPLPVWRCERGHVTVVGSLDELSERAGSSPLTDPHRPYVDDIALQCECGEPAARVPELVAPWFEAAAMPFATAPRALRRRADARRALPRRPRLRAAGPAADVVVVAAKDVGPAARRRGGLRASGRRAVPWHRRAEERRRAALGCRHGRPRRRGARRAPDERMRTRLVECAGSPRRRPDGRRPLHPIAPERHDRARRWPPRRLRRASRRRGDRGLRRRPLRLVRALVAHAPDLRRRRRRSARCATASRRSRRCSLRSPRSSPTSSTSALTAPSRASTSAEWPVAGVRDLELEAAIGLVRGSLRIPRRGARRRYPGTRRSSDVTFRCPARARATGQPKGTA